MTFEKDTKDKDLINETMDEMIEDSMKQLKEQEFKSYRTVTIKVRYEDFYTVTKAFTLKDKAFTAEPGKSVAKNLLKPFLKDKRKVRLIGISLSKLE